MTVLEPGVQPALPAPPAPRPLPTKGAEREARARAAAELRRRLGLSKRETRAWYARFVHHDRLRRGRAVVDAIGMMGR